MENKNMAESDLSYFAVHWFGIGMLLIGYQFGDLQGWLFWFPLGLLTTGAIRWTVSFLDYIRNLRKKMS